MYIEKLDGAGCDHIGTANRDNLRHLCQPVSMADVKDSDDIVVEAQVGGDYDEADNDG